jgi:hypothetical protein
MQRSIFEVTKIAHTELLQLLARREEIAGRIRSVRQVIDGSEVFANQPASAGNTARRSAGRACSVIQTRSNQTELKQLKPKPTRSSRVHAILRRACRIALMEGQETASPKEIYDRITRRGSFSFVNSESAISSVVWMLNAMTDDGEVTRLEDGQTPRWCLALRAEEASGSVESQDLGTPSFVFAADVSGLRSAAK